MFLRKKSHYLKISQLLLSILLCFNFLLLFCNDVKSESETPSKRTIVVIRYRIAPNYFSTVLKGLESALRQRGYKNGENIRIVDVITETADKNSIPKATHTVNEYIDKADVFVTCGWLSMYVRKLLKDTNIPQFFCPVLKSVALKMLPSVKKKPGTNLSGIYLMYPPEKLLRISRLILPSAVKYAYVYDSKIPADMVFKNAFQNLPDEKRHGFQLIYLDISNGIEEVIKRIKKEKIHVYGGIVGAFKNREKLKQAGIPMVTALTLDIEKDEIAKWLKDSNIIAGLFNPFSYCGHETGEMIADIFDGKKRIEDIVPQPALQIAFVNMDAASRFKIYIPFRALEAVDLVIK